MEKYREFLKEIEEFVFVEEQSGKGRCDFCSGKWVSSDGREPRVFIRKTIRRMYCQAESIV